MTSEQKSAAVSIFGGLLKDPLSKIPASSMFRHRASPTWIPRCGGYGDTLNRSAAKLHTAKLTNDCSHHSLDNDIPHEDWLHGSVRWLQSDTFFFFVESFECGVRVIKERHYDLPIARVVVTFDDNVISV